MTTATQPKHTSVLGVIIIWNIVSTTLHYAHNFVMADDYPPVYPFFPNSLAYRVGIIIFWPLLTWLGVWAFSRYRSGKTRRVSLGLVAYALLGFTTIFHFVGGVPQIPTFFFVTIFTDFAGGTALLGFAAFVYLNNRRAGIAPAHAF